MGTFRLLPPPPGLDSVRVMVKVTRLRLGVQTGKYENTGASIPAEERKCLVCKENFIENEGQLSRYCKGYNNNKNSTQWVHESNASWTVSAVEIC